MAYSSKKVNQVQHEFCVINEPCYWVMCRLNNSYSKTIDPTPARTNLRRWWWFRMTASGRYHFARTKSSPIYFKSDIWLFLVLSWQMSLVEWVELSALFHVHCRVLFWPSGWSQRLMATLYVVAGSHREGQLCVGCACVCLSFLHTPATLLNMPLHQKDREDDSEWFLPTPSTFFQLKCVWKWLSLLHGF